MEIMFLCDSLQIWELSIKQWASEWLNGELEVNERREWNEPLRETRKREWEWGGKPRRRRASWFIKGHQSPSHARIEWATTRPHSQLSLSDFSASLEFQQLFFPGKLLLLLLLHLPSLLPSSPLGQHSDFSDCSWSVNYGDRPQIASLMLTWLNCPFHSPSLRNLCLCVWGRVGGTTNFLGACPCPLSRSKGMPSSMPV